VPHHFILNPAAGGGRAGRALPELRSALKQSKLEHVIYLTERAGQAREIARGLPANEPVIAAGGDGTQHEIVSALLEGRAASERALGIIPLGTGDDFARCFGLPIGNLRAALEVIVQGKLETIDAGRLNGVPFINGIGSGFDAVLVAPGFLPGSLKYLWAIISELTRLEPRPARVEIDGQTVHDHSALLVSIMNLTSYGGGLKIAPNASPTDGLLEVVVGGHFSKLDTLGILPKLQKGTHIHHPQVQVFRGRTVRVEWFDLTAAHIDGELLEPTRTLEASIVPKALRVFKNEVKGQREK
jgi:diacylglycerol kinase (ATP)